MKTTANKKLNIDPIAEAKKGAYFEQFTKESRERIRLGVEIYNAREILSITQQELAKRAKTTQRIISQIENGDVNLGFASLNRITTALNFNYHNWARVFNFTSPYQFIFIGSKTSKTAIETKGNILSAREYNLSIKK